MPEWSGTSCQNLDASAISALPAARTEQISRVNSDYQAVSSLTKAIPRQLYGDHGHAESLQSRSAFWMYEAAAKIL